MNPWKALADMIQRKPRPDTRANGQKIERLKNESDRALDEAKKASKLASYGRIELRKQ